MKIICDKQVKNIMTLSIVFAKYVAPLKVELHFSDSTI